MLDKTQMCITRLQAILDDRWARPRQGDICLLGLPGRWIGLFVVFCGFGFGCVTHADANMLT
jgi:hypothetical protein